MFSSRRSILAIPVLLLGLALVVIFSTMNPRSNTAFAFNHTDSMPTGYYLKRPFDPGEISRGEIVAVCLPKRIISTEKAQFEKGPCKPFGTEPLVKTIAAIPGDVVDVEPDGESVDGHLLAHTKRYRVDDSKKSIPSIPIGRYVVGPGRIWLYGPNDGSWDSRYYGAVPMSGVLWRMEMLVHVAGNKTKRPQH